jgi:hypothetical protein
LYTVADAEQKDMFQSQKVILITTVTLKHGALGVKFGSMHKSLSVDLSSKEFIYYDLLQDFSFFNSEKTMEEISGRPSKITSRLELPIISQALKWPNVFRWNMDPQILKDVINGDYTEAEKNNGLQLSTSTRYGAQGNLCLEGIESWEYSSDREGGQKDKGAFNAFEIILTLKGD